jgi:5'(3')-deoxyribonucleotidase
MRLVKNMYNKKVEFNFVNLNKMHLNSDIFTQAVSLKLKNRDNKLFRVLRSSLTNIHLPNVSRISEKYSKTDRNEYLINKIRNIYINSMFKNDNTNIDSLNNLLLDFFPYVDNLNIEIKKRSSTIKRVITLQSFILRSLKHKNLAGVRLEAKGRLTRRFTAARSVFKVK